MFLIALVAAVLSFVVLLTVAADVFSGDDGGRPGSPGSTAVDATSTEQQAQITGAPASPTPAPANTAVPTAPAPADPVDGSIPVTCGDVLAPLDKQHKLAANCAPPDLVQLPAAISAQGSQFMRAEAAAALQELFAAAQKEQGYAFAANSAYRSYDTQVATYNSAVASFGREYADRTSARPGHSEHQMGTTTDVGARGLFLEDFIASPEAAWLAANAYRFGFVVSYPDGKEGITGYAYEPWHIRYVGKAVAQQVKDSGLTLHEFLLR
jgi:D-alanyl-D-alanine carboxypeptidase